MPHCQAEFTFKNWKEYDIEAMPLRVSKASAELVLKGKIQGFASLNLLILYKKPCQAGNVDKTHSYNTGIYHFDGSVDGKKGTFIMIAKDGEYKNLSAKSNLEIMDGSGSGELKNISGKASYTYPEAGVGYFTLDYCITE